MTKPLNQEEKERLAGLRKFYGHMTVETARAMEAREQRNANFVGSRDKLYAGHLFRRDQYSFYAELMARENL
jgi:hypothetical protein